MSQAKLSIILNEIERRKGKSLGFDPSPYSFPQQLKFVNDESQFVDALTTRRAGKSNGLALKMFKAGLKHKGAMIPYLALTRDSAKNIMWNVLQEQADTCKIKVTFTESNLTAKIVDTDASIRLYGADMNNFIKRLRGIKSPIIAIDEAGEFGSHLMNLVDDVLTPCISDYVGGQIALTGTPGPVPFGYFYDVTEMKRYGYSHHHWSLYDNPYMPAPRAFVESLKKRKGWTDENPTYLREWCGRWVKDLDVLVIKYDPDRNSFIETPKTTSHVIAVDIGFHDADAIAVIGWGEHDTRSYLVHEDVSRKQGITELAVKIGKYIKQYNPNSVVMDTGGLGAKIAEELRRRYSLPIKAAEKSRKFEFIELLNDAMRMQQFFARTDSVFAQDSMKLQWDQDKLMPDKLVVSKKFHSDICFPAGTMITTDQGLIPIEQVTTDHLALTRHGFRKVLASALTSEDAPIVELCFSNGMVLNCTPSHPVWTEQKGFIRAENLSLTDSFVTSRPCAERLLNLRVLASIDIQNQAGRTLETTFGVTTTKSESHFIEHCGRMPLGQYRQSTTFTTKTGTPSTTLLKILNAFHLPSTFLNTKKSERFEAFLQRVRRIWPKPTLHQKLGMPPQKELSGTKSTPLFGLKRIESSSQSLVQCAKKIISGMSLALQRHYTALEHAEPKQEGSLGSMTSNIDASIATLPSEQAASNIGSIAVSLVRLPSAIVSASVYNLTVEEHHEYFANGILVSNCDAVLYGFRESLHWLEVPEIKGPEFRSDEWFKEQEDKLFEEALKKQAKSGDDSPDFDNDSPWGDSSW